MGDISRGINCDKFVKEFGDDVIARCRSRILDRTFGDAVRYYVGVDDVNWITTLCATVRTGSEKDEETFVLTVEGNLFYPEWDDADMIANVASLIEITPDEARRRLVKAGLLDAKPCTCAALNSSKDCPAHDTEIDYAGKRIGSAHMEDVIGGRTRCGICGWIDTADPKDPTVRAWHGDSFGDDDIPHPKPAAPSEEVADRAHLGEPRGRG